LRCCARVRCRYGARSGGDKSRTNKMTISFDKRPFHSRYRKICCFSSPTYGSAAFCRQRRDSRFARMAPELRSCVHRRHTRFRPILRVGSVPLFALYVKGQSYNGDAKQARLMFLSLSQLRTRRGPSPDGSCTRWRLPVNMDRRDAPTDVSGVSRGECAGPPGGVVPDRLRSLYE
jgi:hypothetical protein